MQVNAKDKKDKEGDLSRYADIGKMDMRSKAEIDAEKAKARRAIKYKGY